MGDEQLEPAASDAFLDINTLAARHQGQTLWTLTVPGGPLELMETDRGELVLWAYSDFLLLVESCGLGQPYARATPREVADFAAQLDKPLKVAVDVWHPEGRRYPEPDIFEQEPLKPLIEVPEREERFVHTLVWVPTLPVVDGAPVIEVELHEHEGRPVLSVFTLRENVHKCCGPYQAAVGIWSPYVGHLAKSLGVEVAWDPVLAESARHKAPVLNWKLHNYFEEAANG